MPVPGEPLQRLGFLTMGLFDPADPAPGHESTLQLIELGERLGFDIAWLRHRHLQYGISSPVAVMAAVSQRTQHIELGTAVTPLGWENPLRLAEDLATVDVLSGGRINPGFSVGEPRHYEQLKSGLYPTTSDVEDFSYGRVERFMSCIAGEPVSAFSGREGFEEFSARVEPHSPGLSSRLWYGAGSQRSARWAGEHALNLLTSNIVVGEQGGPTDFAAVQRDQIRVFRAAHPEGSKARVSHGLVVIPTDSATSEQRAKYAAYVEARTPRTYGPQGPQQMLIAQDLIGSGAQIAEALYAHAAFQEADDVAFALPFTFAPEDYVQILTDIAGALGPALGWTPTRQV